MEATIPAQIPLGLHSLLIRIINCI